VLTAHYDHVGINSKGEINNGADDNGSGTVTLLEVAEAFTKMKKKPRRSIIFAWVTAEEKGLIGSEYYTENPVFPLEKTVANINLDMVGRSAEKEPETCKSRKKPDWSQRSLYYYRRSKFRVNRNQQQNM
jgi:Zn-dependent M28 family amino/carboxypeptidase